MCLAQNEYSRTFIRPKRKGAKHSRGPFPRPGPTSPPETSNATFLLPLQRGHAHAAKYLHAVGAFFLPSHGLLLVALHFSFTVDLRDGLVPAVSFLTLTF